MVGQQILDLLIKVRVLVSQPFFLINPLMRN